MNLFLATGNSIAQLRCPEDPGSLQKGRSDIQPRPPLSEKGLWCPVLSTSSCRQPVSSDRIWLPPVSPCSYMNFAWTMRVLTKKRDCESSLMSCRCFWIRNFCLCQREFISALGTFCSPAMYWRLTPLASKCSTVCYIKCETTIRATYYSFPLNVHFNRSFTSSSRQDFKSFSRYT